VITRDYFQRIIRDHPVAPVPRDPLAPAEGRETAASTAAIDDPPRLAFACHWEADQQRTWSGSAWNLRAALQSVTQTTDLGVQVPRLSRAALKALHTRFYGGRLTTTWVYSPVTDFYVRQVLRKEIHRSAAAWSCDAAVVIDDLAVLPIPFFTYYDSSWDLLISAVENTRALASLRAISPATVARRRDRQIAVYEQAAGVLAFSRWHARSLVEQSGVSPEKVHVILPAVRHHRDAGRPDGPGDRSWPVPDRRAPRRRLLFVGRQHQSYDFYRKGGDLVVGALAILRRECDPEITLTIAGVDNFPLPGTPPEGVRLLGSVPASEVNALYDSHDLFVMPSRFEPFGLVFAEALARGLPCVARNACAMPEIVTPGVSGALVSGEDAHDLAAAIAGALANDGLYESCAARARAFGTYFSWERTAADVVRVISRSLGAG
jgi:glycosyltransferase involved in cell wall biosynthesis